MSQVFAFQSHHIRTAIIDDQPWFVARDVCAALGIGWTGHSLKGVPTAWIGMVRHTTPRKGGNQTHSLRVISEPAVYKLAFRSHKPEADEFTNWVASEVLPAIRKTGKYGSTPKALPKPRQKALPVAQPSYREQCVEITAQMLELRGKLFHISNEMMRVFREPFWGPQHGIPEEKKTFAEAMNHAVQCFFMTVNKDLETAELLFNAYVEGERILNR